jgi:hypothetical protein
MLESKSMPTIRRSNQGVLVPYCVTQVTREAENGGSETFYRFQQIRLDQAQLPSLDQAAKQVWRKLQADLHQYIYARYDPGTQQTIQAYAQKADHLGRSDIVDECERIFDWVDDVLAYYDQRKAAVFGAGNEAELVSVSWDFPGSVPIPGGMVGWRDIRAMFSN